MIEVELYFCKVMSGVRELETEYLGKVKRKPLAQDLPEVKEVTAEEYAKMKFWARFCYSRALRKQQRARMRAERAQERTVEDELAKGYCKGVEDALKVLSKEFTLFKREQEREE